MFTHKFVKTKRDRIKRNASFYIFCFILIMFIGSFLCVWSRLSVVHFGYRLANTYNEEKLIISERLKLTSDIAKLAAPVRIEPYAKEHLGLDYPGKGQFVILVSELGAK